MIMWRKKTKRISRCDFLHKSERCRQSSYQLHSRISTHDFNIGACSLLIFTVEFKLKWTNKNGIKMLTKIVFGNGKQNMCQLVWAKFDAKHSYVSNHLFKFPLKNLVLGVAIISSATAACNLKGVSVEKWNSAVFGVRDEEVFFTLVTALVFAFQIMNFIFWND